MNHFGKSARSVVQVVGATTAGSTVLFFNIWQSLLIGLLSSVIAVLVLVLFNKTKS